MYRELDDYEFQNLIGKTLEEAEKIIPDMTIRVVILEGKPLMCTEDFNTERLNVGVRNNVIDYIKGRG